MAREHLDNLVRTGGLKAETAKPMKSPDRSVDVRPFGSFRIVGHDRNRPMAP